MRPGGAGCGDNAHVNLEVDRVYKLEAILDVDSAWEVAHRIRALAHSSDGQLYRSVAIKELADLKAKHRDDYKKILKVVKLVAEKQRVSNENHVKRSKNWPEIYEIRGGNARLFFFYSEFDNEIVVCTGVYHKSSDSKNLQDIHFERCNRFRLAYEAYRAKIEH